MMFSEDAWIDLPEREDEPEPEFTDCGGGREAMLRGCQCDACACGGCDEYHRQKDLRLG